MGVVLPTGLSFLFFLKIAKNFSSFSNHSFHAIIMYSSNSLFPICVKIFPNTSTAKNRGNKVCFSSLSVPLWLLHPARGPVCVCAQRARVRENNRMSAGVTQCSCHLPPSSLGLQRSSWSEVDTEVCSNNKLQPKHKVLWDLVSSLHIPDSCFYYWKSGLTTSRQWECWDSILGAVWK